MIEPSPIIFLSFADALFDSVSQASISVLTVPTVNQSSPVEIPHTISRRMSVRRILLNNSGAKDTNYCLVKSQTNELIVAKPELMFFFNREGRGPYLAFVTDGSRPLRTAVVYHITHSTEHGSVKAYYVANKPLAYRIKRIVSFCSDESKNQVVFCCWSWLMELYLGLERFCFPTASAGF